MFNKGYFVYLGTLKGAIRCDKCGKVFHRDNVLIPRIIVCKTVEFSDLEKKDMFAFPDYCDYCVQRILGFMQTQNALKFETPFLNHTSRMIMYKVKE